MQGCSQKHRCPHIVERLYRVEHKGRAKASRIMREYRLRASSASDTAILYLGAAKLGSIQNMTSQIMVARG